MFGLLSGLACIEFVEPGQRQQDVAMQAMFVCLFCSNASRSREQLFSCLFIVLGHSQMSQVAV